MASRQRKAYCRKLLLAHIVSTGRHDLRSLEACTGMPRRTLQDSLADLGDIGIACTFVQDGPKNNHGFYRIQETPSFLQFGPGIRIGRNPMIPS